MSWFSRLFGKRNSGLPANQGDPVLLDLLGGPPNRYGVAVTPETAMRVAAVFSCVRILAESIAAMPLMLYRRVGDDKERATDHPLYRVVHSRPNAYQTTFEFLDQMVTNVALRGWGAAEVQVSAAGGRQLVPLDVDRLQAALMDDNSVAYRYWAPNGPRILLQDEVLRVMYATKDGVTPISPIRAQADTIGGAIAAQRYTAGFFKNGGRPPGWLEHPSHFEKDEMRRRFRTKFQEQFSGEDAGATPLLENGVKYHVVGVSNEDAQLLELHKWNVADIARIYRVPLVLLSETEKSTSWGTGIESFQLSFVTHTLRPWLVRTEQALSRDLLTEREQQEYFFEFNLDALLRADALTRARVYEIHRRIGTMSANDVLRKENQNVIGEQGDVYGDMNPHQAADPSADDPQGKQEGQTNG